MTMTSLAYNPLSDTFVAAPPKPRAELVVVDPTMAALWLLRNTENRSLADRALKSYSADMRAGEWVVTGDGPKFSADGLLLNGQHTLTALIDANVTIEMFVFWNMSRDAQRAMDGGRIRTYSDHLGLTGERNTSSLGAVVRRVILFTRGTYGPTCNVEPTKAEMDAFLRANPRLKESVRIAVEVGRAIKVAPSAVGTAHFVFAGISPSDAETFMLRLRDGANLAPGSPILTLRERLGRARQERINTASLEVLAWYMRAWEAYRAGKTMKIMRFSSTEAFPVPSAWALRKASGQ